MDVRAIFLLQLILSLVVWGLIAKWLLAPWLERKSVNEALFFLTLPHAFRYMGMVFLVPGVVARPLPSAFATAAAYGDLVTGLLALLALFALRTGGAWALALVWLFNIVGTFDLLNALRHTNVVSDFGAVWYIPTLFVPLLLVTHLMIFARLLRRATTSNT
ncbi:MAG: hypothetical protein V3U38_01180 [Gemmatimonadota bacterium]|nr:hypothetical protein [Candidatus Palauibacterales bacterium]